MQRKLSSHNMKLAIILVVSALVIGSALLWAARLIISSNRHPVSTLTLHKNNDAVATTYNGVPVIEACNIVSFDELRGKGIKVAGTPYPDTFVRTYIEDTEGAAPLDGLELQHEPNSCHYQLQKRGGLFNIIVYQPAYSDMQALEAKIAREYNSQPNIGDMKVYRAKTYHNRDEDFFNTVSTNEDNEDFIIRKGDSAVWFRLRPFEPSTRQEVLRLVSANFSKLLQQPEARATIDYRNSPIKGKLYKACELLSAENAMQLIRQDLNPVVKEGYTGAPGTRNYQTSNGRPDGYMYVAQSCERSTSMLNNRLTMDLRQYASEEGAKHYIQAAASGVNSTRQQWRATELTLGDESYIEADDGDNNVAYVRKGRLVLAFTHHLDGERRSSSVSSVQRLEPVITSVLEKIVADSRQ